MLSRVLHIDRRIPADSDICKKTCYLFEKNLLYAKSIFSNAKRFRLCEEWMLRVFGWHRRFSGEFASFSSYLRVDNSRSEVLGKALSENAFKVSWFLLCDGKFFVRMNEKFCPCLDCYGHECCPNFCQKNLPQLTSN